MDTFSSDIRGKFLHVFILKRINLVFLFYFVLFFIFQTINDTRSAIQQISELVSNTFSPESTTPKFPAIMTPKKSENNETNSDENSSDTGFKPTPQEFQNLIRRNIKGLIRLFNIEWNDAIKVS